MCVPLCFSPGVCMKVSVCVCARVRGHNPLLSLNGLVLKYLRFLRSVRCQGYRCFLCCPSIILFPSTYLPLPNLLVSDSLSLTETFPRISIHTSPRLVICPLSFPCFQLQKTGYCVLNVDGAILTQGKLCAAEVGKRRRVTWGHLFS